MTGHVFYAIVCVFYSGVLLVFRIYFRFDVQEYFAAQFNVSINLLIATPNVSGEIGSSTGDFKRLSSSVGNNFQSILPFV